MTESKDIVPAQPSSGSASTTTRVVDERLATAQSPQEIVLWAQVRGEIIRQDEEAVDRQHKRWMNRASLIAKVGMSVVGVGAGVALLLAGHQIGGLFALGAGLYRLAPAFTKQFFERNRVGGAADE